MATASPTDAAPAPGRRRWSLRRRLAVGALAALAASAVWFWRALPEPLFGAPYSTVLFARDGELLGARVAADGHWRFPLAGPVPERYATALIEYEDRRFRDHHGVDLLAVARAARDNLRAGRVVSGASTIPMQVVRLALGPGDRSLARKAHEALLALRLELAFSKDEVLALHAQHAPFGANVVGLEAASWRWFGRPPRALTWAEAATLAVLPNSPALVHPARGRAALAARRDALLRRLHARGHLGDLDLRLALAEPIPAAPHPLPRRAPHLLDTLIAEGAGPVVRSSIDASLQDQVAEVAARRAEELARHGVANAAVIVLDNATARVLAYVGNTARRDGMAPAVDLLARPRSSGSILKPLLYALLLQEGRVVPRTLVPDVPTRVAGFAPENHDKGYRGAVRVDAALALSLNVPAVRLLREHGVERFHGELGRMGFSTLFRSPEGYGLTLVLGGAEVAPREVAAAYADLAWIVGAGGGEPRYRRPTALEGAVATGERAGYGPGAAWLTLQALEQVNRPGLEVHWRNFASSRRVAWKTGTSWGLRDAWAVAVTPQHTVAVWAGNADGHGVAGLSGTETAGPLLFAVLNLLPASGWFAEPMHDLATVEVCSADGLRPREGCPTVRETLPAGVAFERPSPYQRRVQLDASGRWRVDSGCYPVARMQQRNWFVLPPVMEHFHRRRDPGYRALPPWRAGCGAGAAEPTIGLLYPEEGMRLLIPVELDGSKGRAIFEAVHGRADAVLYWHLDDRYLGQTREFHEMQIEVAPGPHLLTLVDDRGARLQRRFTVLERR